MIRIGVLSVSLFLTVSCAGLPAITPGLESECPVMALEGDWQFVHSIEVELSGEKKTVLLGVTTVSSEPPVLRSVIMTIEGFVLFDAEMGNRLKVKRAVFPFDAGPFSEGMMENVSLIFRSPTGKQIASGHMKDGVPACRYQRANGQIVDILALTNGIRKIVKYSAPGRPDLTITAAGPGVRRIELVARRPRPYRLHMKLIKADPIAPHDVRP